MSGDLVNSSCDRHRTIFPWLGPESRHPEIYGPLKGSTMGNSLSYDILKGPFPFFKDAALCLDHKKDP